jgi:hypothetical protein
MATRKAAQTITKKMYACAERTALTYMIDFLGGLRGREDVSIEAVLRRADELGTKEGMDLFIWNVIAGAGLRDFIEARESFRVQTKSPKIEGFPSQALIGQSPNQPIVVQKEFHKPIFLIVPATF